MTQRKLLERHVPPKPWEGNVRGRQLEIPLEEAEAVTRRISRKRSLVEYPYAIMKRVFHFSHVMVILTRRVKFMFACFAYNLHAVKILQG